MNKKELFLNMMNFRHACKIFDEKRVIDDEDFLYLLEAFRLSPSSFGMEPWRLLVITDNKIKRDLKPLCWNQKQITTCSHLVVIKIDKKSVQDDEYIKKMFARRGLDENSTKAYIEKYKEFLKKQEISCWCKKQCYIAAANMMDAAAFIGIDSCPIEGFDKEKVEKYFNLNTEEEEVALILTFGYRVNPAPQKKRLPLNEIVTFLK